MAGTPTAAALPRPRWVELYDGSFATLIKLTGRSGRIALIRHNIHPYGYAWASVDGLMRRPDLDHVTPEWLKAARCSPRPNPDLYYLVGKVATPPDATADDDEVLRPQPMFETDDDGRPIS